MPFQDEKLAKFELKMHIRRENLQDYARRSEAIGRGRDHWERMGLKGRKEFDSFMLEKKGHQAKIPFALADARGDAVLAFINDNRWMARCECGGLAVVDPDEPQFYCLTCFNFSNGGYPRPVAFPNAAIRQEIEDTLMASDDPLVRNWSALLEDGNLPGSARVNRGVDKDELIASIGALKAWNLAHGLPATRSRE